MHSATMFLIAALDAAGLKGFTPDTDNDPDHGRLSLIDAQGRKIQYGNKMSGWHCTGYTDGIDSSLLPMPFKSAK